MDVFKFSEDTNTTFKCCADRKRWSYVSLLNFQMDGWDTLINFLSHHVQQSKLCFGAKRKIENIL